MTIDGKTYNGGEVVEVGNWRNLKTLQSNRYIEILQQEEKPKVEPKVEPKAKTEVKQES